MKIKKASALTAALALGGMLFGGIASAKPGAPTPCEPSAKACVSLSTGQAWLTEDGHATYGPVPLSAGKPDAPTPTGVFQVNSKDADHHSREFDNAPMPNSVFFAPGGVAFHEGSLEKQSNGCVHLSTTAAKRFFDGLNPGDEVQVLQ